MQEAAEETSILQGGTKKDKSLWRQSVRIQSSDSISTESRSKASMTDKTLQYTKFCNELWVRKVIPHALFKFLSDH
jgi:hypothetical protein